MTRRKTIFLAVLLLLLLACTLPGMLASPAVPAISTGYQIIAQAPPGSTATPTPFQPLPPTPTYLPTSFPTVEPTSVPYVEPVSEINPGESRNWSDYPGPIVWPDVEVPPPAGILPHPEGQINILLLGSDQRPYDGGFRTDTIILLTINPVDGSAHMTSFPRDLYVYIPGWTVQRINTAFGWGGFEALSLTVEYNFGVHPDHYVLVNLWSFEEMIDSLGGIRVEIGRDLCDHRDAFGEYCVSQSTMWMSGETALWYVRSRYSTSDFDRGRRQQEVIRGIFDQILSIDGLRRAPELYDLYINNVTTDMSFEDMVGYVPLAADIGQSRNIEHYYIGPQQVISWVNYSGAQVLLPVRESVLDVMRQALNSP